MSNIHQKVYIHQAELPVGLEIEKSSDRERFERLMRQSYRKVFQTAYGLSGNRADAEDLTQQAFLRAYRHFEDYEGDRPFTNWVFRIVKRLYLDLLRLRRRRLNPMSYDAPLPGDENLQFEAIDKAPDPEDYYLGATVGEELEAALQCLDQTQLRLLILKDIEQVPYKEIAEVMCIPVGTVRSRIHRMHRTLRVALVQSRRLAELD